MSSPYNEDKLFKITRRSGWLIVVLLALPFLLVAKLFERKP